jgi:hypothetical protein
VFRWRSSLMTSSMMKLKRALQILLNFGVRGVPSPTTPNIRGVNALLIAMIVVSILAALAWQYPPAVY